MLLNLLKIKQTELEKKNIKLKKIEKDIDLLISQSDRCNQILKKLSLNPNIEDEFIDSKITLQDYLSEIIHSFQEMSKKIFFLKRSIK